MQTMDAIVLELVLTEINGGLCVTSPDLPELMLFSYNRREVLNDLLPTAETLMALNHGIRFAASIIPAGESRPGMSNVAELPPGTHKLYLRRLSKGWVTSAKVR